MSVEVEIQAYVGAVGAPEDGRWNAHIEPVPMTTANADQAEWSCDLSHVADAVAWARERTDWVLVVTDPLQWGGSPDKQPPDVPLVWQA